LVLILTFGFVCGDAALGFELSISAEAGGEDFTISAQLALLFTVVSSVDDMIFFFYVSKYFI
jgi:hypothetical protein